MSKEGLEGARLSLHDFLEVFSGLDAPEWSAPSACAGWRVQEVAAHISSNLKEIIEPSPPPDEPPPQLKAEEAMEALVAPRREWPWEDVRAELQRYAQPGLGAFAAMQEEPVASAELTLGDLGTYQTHMLADAFAFDLFCHLRNDILAPRGPVRRDVAPVDAARLAPAVGWMLAGLPQMCAQGLGDLDGTIGLELTGAAPSAWTISGGSGAWTVERDGGAAGNPRATVRSDAADFVLWGTKREEWRPLVHVEGDAGFAGEFLDRLNII